MKSNTDHHREALEQALRIALGTSQPALRRQALTRAASHLIHPKLVLESPLLTNSHPWRQEALLVSDAFEAATNGMEEPGLFEALEELSPESPFHAWKHLILAIHFFYEHLDEAVLAHLAQIPPESPVQSLVQALELVLQARERSAPAARRLADLVAQPDPLVHQWVQDVAEGLETDDEALFWAALTDWLEPVNQTAPDRARAAVLWAWNQLEWRDFDEAVLLDLGTSLWGRAESYRLAALGTLPWDPEGAALLWFRFLLTVLREGAMAENALREARDLLDQFQDAAEAAGPATPEGQETWANLALAWNDEIKVRGWTDLLVGAAAPQPYPDLSSPPAHGQLDLFA